MITQVCPGLRARALVQRMNAATEREVGGGGLAQGLGGWLC